MTSPLKSEALLPITPPSMQPKEVPRSPIETSETPGTAESKSAVRTPLQLQQRLIELGYMFSGADGKWGPQSKRALLEYKRQAGLKPGDALDAMTEQSLFSANAPRANRHLLFVGGWSSRARPMWRSESTTACPNNGNARRNQRRLLHLQLHTA